MRTGKEKTSPITGLEGKQRLLFFAFCLITAAVPVLYPIVKGHGMFFIEDDFVTQQVPFITYLSGMVKQGIDTWSWDVDLGSSTIQAFTFYELGSPFFWLIALFPQRFAPYLIGPVMLLKYLTACYTAQMFLKRFVKTAWNAVPGALFYAFSGFQETNIVFNHFHDAVALFPLMLVGLELVMDDTDRSARTSHGLFFAMAVFLNAVVNYFFFAQTLRYVYSGISFSPFTSTFANIGYCMLNLSWQVFAISSLVPGACSLNWLHGKSSIMNPWSLYFSYSGSSPLYCGVSPHSVALFTISIVFPSYSLRETMFPCRSSTSKSYIDIFMFHLYFFVCVNNFYQLT